MGEPKKPARVKVADDPIRHAACQAVQLFSRCLRLVGVRVRHGRHAVTLVATLCPATTLARTAVVARQREVALFGQDAQQEADLQGGPRHPLKVVVWTSRLFATGLPKPLRCLDRSTLDVIRRAFSQVDQ